MVGDDLPGFINERGQWPRQLQTMCMDGISIVIGSCLGTRDKMETYEQKLPTPFILMHVSGSNLNLCAAQEPLP